MSKRLTEDKIKAMNLYQMLCINKRASTQYLVETGKILKLEDTAERKKIHNENMSNLLKAIE